MRRMKSLLTLSLALTALVTLTAEAQSHGKGIEITPTAGYRWGGTINAWTLDTIGWDADIEDSSTFGLVIDIPISRSLQLELMAERQSTELNLQTWMEPFWIRRDIDITFYHVGVLWQWHTKHIDPFVVGSLGVTDLDTGLTYGDETRFSVGIGGGFKLWLSEHVGFRLEARSFWTDTGSEDSRGWCGTEDDWHDWHDWRDQDLIQGEIKAGVIFSF